MDRKRKLALDDAPSSLAPPPSTNNLWNDGKGFSQRYYEIMEKRMKLPVWEQKEQFYQLMNNNQTIVFVGETGSGKTTQVPKLIRSSIFNSLI